MAEGMIAELGIRSRSYPTAGAVGPRIMILNSLHQQVESHVPGTLVPGSTCQLIGIPRLGSILEPCAKNLCLIPSVIALLIARTCGQVTPYNMANC